MFKSVLKEEMASFLMMRTFGMSSRTVEADRYILIHFDEYLDGIAWNSKILSEDVISAWVTSLSGKSKTISEKIGTIRAFVKYLNSYGNESFLPDRRRVKTDYLPYIFSDEELQAIFKSADNINLTYHASSTADIMMPMLIRILYGCGTRLTETISLKRKDIDFEASTLMLRKTKNSKERLIPIHVSLRDILEKYCLAMGIMDDPEAYLFPGKSKDGIYTRRQAASWFQTILQKARVTTNETGVPWGGPCLHCFRHLFVLKAISQLEYCGHPISVNDLLLPAYLGHDSILDTDKYMRFAGVNMPEAMDSFESFTEGLIPDVEVPDEEE